MAGSKPPFTVRLARMEDAASLRELIAHSVRVLESPDYSRDQIEGSLEGTQGVDTRLIADGTYYLAEAIEGSGEPLLVGGGGWSQRKTLYGGDSRSDRQDELLDPAVDAAKIRLFLCTRNGRDRESRPQSSKRASGQDAPPGFTGSK